MSVDLKAAIVERLRLDVELSVLLPGGIYDRATLSPTMGPPTPFDSVGRVRPCALARHEVSAAVGPRRRFDRQLVVIFFYDHAGYGAIDVALERVRAMLHEQRLGHGAYQVWHVDTVRDQYDDALLAHMHRARFEVARRGDG